jgi:DNA-binding NtrC family response regulator
MPPSSAPVIALVEDDMILGESLLMRLELEGYRGIWWRTGEEALRHLAASRPDVLLCDIRLPDIDGEQLFRRALPALGDTPVIFMTAFAEVEQAVRLVRAGADDYLTKPFDLGALIEKLNRLASAREAEGRGSEPILGRSDPMRRLEAVLRRVRDIDSTVLLCGETGVGKEVAARCLHDVSARAHTPFVPVNCAAIPAELIESQLFGHEKGAFTGAHARHLGFAEQAAAGTLFLDEIAELPLPMQAKLLRLLQDRSFRRVGGETTLPFRARVVAATNAELGPRLEDGRFRKDLYFRLNVIELRIPPLRCRPEEIAPLLHHFLNHYADAFGRPPRVLSAAAEATATAHDWPGNVRELKNRAERAVALAAAPEIGIADLFPERGLLEEPAGRVPSLSEVRQEAERQHILAALRRTNGQHAEAASLLGISRTTLWEKMRKLEIE